MIIFRKLAKFIYRLSPWKTLKFTLVIILINFPQKWQFWLENESFEISRNPPGPTTLTVRRPYRSNLTLNIQPEPSIYASGFFTKQKFGLREIHSELSDGDNADWRIYLCFLPCLLILYRWVMYIHSSIVLFIS